MSVLLAMKAASLLPLPGLDGHALSNNSIPWTIVFTLTLLTLLPAIVLSMTPMVRLLVVFHFLRQALGTQTAPSNQVLMGLGLMMTWFLMQPVLLDVHHQAVEPFQQGKISGWEAIERGVRSAAGSTCCITRGRRTSLCSPRRRMRRAPEKAATTCRCVWWFRPTCCRS